MTFTFLIAMC